MARPKSWFSKKEINAAFRVAADRGLKVYEYTKRSRDGKDIVGYYVGRVGKSADDKPARLANAKLKLVRPGARASK